MGVLTALLTVLYYGMAYDVFKFVIGAVFRKIFNILFKKEEKKDKSGFDMGGLANLFSNLSKISVKSKKSKKTPEQIELENKKSEEITEALKDL